MAAQRRVLDLPIKEEEELAKLKSIGARAASRRARGTRRDAARQSGETVGDLRETLCARGPEVGR